MSQGGLGPRVRWGVLSKYLFGLLRSAQLFDLEVHQRGYLSTQERHPDNFRGLPLRVHEE